LYPAVVKVLLVVIDAATPRVVFPAIKTGRLPVFQQLAQRGVLRESTTIFPSITPAATTSIITGHYPSRSGIVGASWFDDARQQVAYYGDDFWVIAREGFRTFLDDFLVGLNGDRQLAPTLFEQVEGAGRTAACLNYLIFKGLHDHIVKVPTLLALLPGVRRTEVIKGPSVLCIGDFVATRTLRGKPLEDVGGLLHRFGMDDASTGELLFEVAEDEAFADFTVAYFADNDYRGHEVGPHAALPVIERVDQALGRMFEAAGGLERLLRDTCVIVTSDHGHCEVLADRDAATVHLNRALADFRQAALGQPWADGDEIMICPNMRAAQIYLRETTPARVAAVTSRALSDPRVDHVCWATGERGDGVQAYAITSATRGRLAVWRGGGSADHAIDAAGTRWSWFGDLDVVDAALDDDRLVWRDYPNAFERLVGALDARDSGAVWVTAKPGCEFEVEGGSAHLGGASHGGLHALESASLFLFAGPAEVALPDDIRSIDVAPLCLELLGIPSERRVGDPR
jgi:hypothetical protein